MSCRPLGRSWPGCLTTRAWKPHPKSSALGHLAQLVARMPAVMTKIVKGIDLDLADGPGYSLETTETLLREFDGNVEELKASLAGASEADFVLPWTLLYGGEVIDTASRKTCCETPSIISCTTARS